MKHTPGPWHESSTGNHQGLIVSENTGDNIAVSYDKVNAQLIAAAPDLLRSCMRVKELHSGYWLSHSMNTTKEIKDIAILINEATAILERAIYEATE